MTFTTKMPPFLKQYKQELTTTTITTLRSLPFLHIRDQRPGTNSNLMENLKKLPTSLFSSRINEEAIISKTTSAILRFHRN